MNIRQFVMAYRVDHDRLRAIIPNGYTSLRPVLRINSEIRENELYIELNTPVSTDSARGWLNIAHWNSINTDITCKENGKNVTFTAPFLTITYTGVGIEGGCPAEKDNDGCFFIDGESAALVPPEKIKAHKEFCSCEFAWRFSDGNAHGKSSGESVAVAPTQTKVIYEKRELSAVNAAAIECEQVAGAYTVSFER